MPEAQTVTIRRDGAAATIELNRPDALNAWNGPLGDELLAAVRAVAEDDDVRAVVVTGAGREFSSGADLKDQSGREQTAGGQWDVRARLTGCYHPIITTIRTMPKPVVAAVTGHAYAGGAILALACDFRVMAEGEFGFAVNEINLGFMLPPGMIRMAVDAVGFRPAFELLLTGQSISSQKALQIGLAFEIAKQDSVLERALFHGRMLAEKPPAAFAAVKRSLRRISAGDSSDVSDREVLAAFIDQWFSGEAEKRKRALIQSLAR